MEAIVNTFIIIALVINIIISIYMIKKPHEHQKYVETNEKYYETKNVHLKDEEGEYIKDSLGNFVIERVEEHETRVNTKGK